MALYLIGDVQGCNNALQRLLDEISFSPSQDKLFFLGDLVNRGPDSAGVLRRLMALDGAATCVLGNHDLHLLALAQGVRKPHRKDTLNGILEAPDREDMLSWLRQQRMALREHIDGHDVLMVHAGVLPSWSADKTIALAAEVETVLRGSALNEFLNVMYSNQPDHWDDALSGIDRIRMIVNALTRLRYCDPLGRMEFEAKEGLESTPKGYMPWFDVPDRLTQSITVAFGHWSTLGWLNRSNVLALDSGCVWGGCLSALRLGGSEANRPLAQELIQVQCDQAQAPD